MSFGFGTRNPKKWTFYRSRYNRDHVSGYFIAAAPILSHVYCCNFEKSALNRSAKFRLGDKIHIWTRQFFGLEHDDFVWAFFEEWRGDVKSFRRADIPIAP